MKAIPLRPLFTNVAFIVSNCCCCNDPQLNTLGMTRYVQLYPHKIIYIPWGDRIVCVTIFSFPCHMHSHMLSSEDLSPFLEGGCCYTRSLSWLKKVGGGDSSVVRAPDSWLKGRGFESLLERRENFLLQGWLSVLTVISVSVPPPCYHSST